MNLHEFITHYTTREVREIDKVKRESTSGKEEQENWDSLGIQKA